MATTGDYTGPVITGETLGFIISLSVLIGIAIKLSNVKSDLEKQIITLNHKVELVTTTLQAYKDQQATLADQILLLGNQARELAEHKYQRSTQDLAALRDDIIPVITELRQDMKSVKTFLTKKTDYSGD